MSNYEVGDKFEIEIESEFVDENGNELYRIKGINNLVIDKNELNKLKRIGPRKTVKASELDVDTKVLCWDVDERQKYSRCFATLHNRDLYAYPDGCSSINSRCLLLWGHMALEDGTIVLPE